MSKEIVRVRIRVYGIVQGVGFRYYAKWNAIKLGIKGYAENLPNGSVEILAEGTKENVEKFIEIIKKGPPAAYVERVEIAYEEPKGDYDYFYIL